MTEKVITNNFPNANSMAGIYPDVYVFQQESSRSFNICDINFAFSSFFAAAFEKSVVQWAPDSDVNLCLTCGKAFTLTRRRHHCRLCGGIMCNKCSHFMPFTFASK